MYQEYMGANVLVLVATRGENPMEYVGRLVKEADDYIVLEGASISVMMMSMQRSMMGSGISQIRNNIRRVSISKQYIISIM